MRRIAIATMALALACGGTTEPDGVAEFRELPWTQATPEAPTVQVNGGTGQLLVEGRFAGGRCGDNRSYALRREGRELRLEVRYGPIPGACPTVALETEYEAVFRALEPGTYRVRVGVRFAGQDGVREGVSGEVEVR